MANNNQLNIPLLYREDEKRNKIEQRLSDGYINATNLCKASGKKLNHYLENQSTKDFLTELSTDAGIPASALIQIVRGGVPEFQGTWVHPQVAIHLAQWASPKFAVMVSKWVFEWMSGNIPNKNTLPYHLQRYILNRSEIPPTHFSVFNELMVGLIAPLEDAGYNLPDSMVPDISQGKIFAKWVRENKNMEPNDFPTYTHTYPDGRKIPNVKLYPNSLLGDFRDHFYNVWLKTKAFNYFKDRDGNAIEPLRKVLLSLPQADIIHALGQGVKDNKSPFDQSLKQATDFNPREKG